MLWAEAPTDSKVVLRFPLLSTCFHFYKNLVGRRIGWADTIPMLITVTYSMPDSVFIKQKLKLQNNVNGLDGSSASLVI